MQLSKLTPAVDTHTHTVISGHAWSTLGENCLMAKARGMKGLCLTEHGPAIEGGAPAYVPYTLKQLPMEYEGIRIYRGMEVNILNSKGELDVPDEYLRLCEFAIASIHSQMFPEKMSATDNTSAYIAALENPYIDILGHPDDPAVPCDFDAIIAAAQKNGKLLEFNNNSATGHRPGSGPRLRDFILRCKAAGQRVCVSSDAHFHTQVGSVAPILTLLDELEYPHELIINLTQAGFEQYLQEKAARLGNLAR